MMVLLMSIQCEVERRETAGSFACLGTLALENYRTVSLILKSFLNF